MKKICVVCGKSRGKRTCQIRGNAVVCPPCCASIRDQQCAGCRHYTFAQQYQAEKYAPPAQREFLIEINEDVEKTVEKALELIEHHAFQQAEDLLQQVQREHPRSHLVYYGLGTLYAYQGEHDRAIMHFDKAISIFPYLVEAHYNRAVAYQKKLDIRNMLEAYRKVIEVGDPRDECVRQAKDCLKNFEQHLRDDEGVTLDEYLQSMTHFERGVEYMRKQKWKKAIHAFQQCLMITARHPQSYGNLGLCYAQLGQKALALEAFDAAIALDPQYELALANRAFVKSLPEGESLPSDNMDVIEYYKEYPAQKRSYLQELVQKLKG